MSLLKITFGAALATAAMAKSNLLSSLMDNGRELSSQQYSGPQQTAEQAELAYLAAAQAAHVTLGQQFENHQATPQETAAAAYQAAAAAHHAASVAAHDAAHLTPSEPTAMAFQAAAAAHAAAVHAAHEAAHHALSSSPQDAMDAAAAYQMESQAAYEVVQAYMDATNQQMPAPEPERKIEYEYGSLEHVFEGKGLFTANCALRLREDSSPEIGVMAGTLAGGVLMRHVEDARFAPLKVRGNYIPLNVKQVKLEVWNRDPMLDIGSAEQSEKVAEWTYDTQAFFNQRTVTGYEDIDVELGSALGQDFFWLIRDADKTEPWEYISGCRVEIKEVGQYINGNGGM